jgi:hypothetical protein
LPSGRGRDAGLGAAAEKDIPEVTEADRARLRAADEMTKRSWCRFRGARSGRRNGRTATVHLMATPPNPPAGAKTEFDVLDALFSPASVPTRQIDHFTVTWQQD